MSKKHVYVFFGFLLCIACSGKNSRHTSTRAVALPVTPVEVARANASTNAPNRSGVLDTVDIAARESKAIHSVSDLVSRVGPELRVRLLNGRTAIFKDDTTAGLRFGLPRYAAYLRAIHSHVIHVYQYEGEGIYFVVDDSTGDSTMVF